MDPLQRVLSALVARDCRPRGSEEKGWIALCPAHDDRHPSLSVSYRQGRVLIHCHAGCTPEAVLDALALDWADLFAGDRCRK